MLLLNSISDIVRVITPVAATTIEVHASWVDINGTTITPGRLNTRITTATTTTVVPSPAASTTRNLKGLYITNNSAATSVNLAVEHTDGTTSVELMQFILLPGENMGYREDGSWVHRDSNGAEYPPAGLGAITGYTSRIMKSGTAPDTAFYWYCDSKDAGFPGAWAPGVPGVNGRVTDGTAAADFGCMLIRNPSVGVNYITYLEMFANIPHQHLFFDCLWVNSGLAITTGAQAITSPTLPARDLNGSTNGEGCTIALLITTASTQASAVANSTVTYTNSDGTATRTATLVGVVGAQIPATPAIGTFVLFSLQAGDRGVRSIQSINLGTALTAGTISLMIIREVVTIAQVVAAIPVSKELSKPGVRIYNGTCMLHAYMASAATATFCSGDLQITEK